MFLFYLHGLLQDQSDCTDTGFRTIENRHKPLFLEELKKIWDNESSDLPWSKGRYSSSNTLLIDDSPYTALLNPTYFLEGLAEAEDVPTYVASHPLGQPAITSTDRNWGFYSRIIRAYANKQWWSPHLRLASLNLIFFSFLKFISGVKVAFCVSTCHIFFFSFFG
ncbi:hypothetical protein QJS04_geneDACA008378 [Acorus gramineus]|uniref:FCP1 homology domain-containing protein n=1 Tax=Acorus gramineus TaxID=55184 RepID=A0AAV9AI51_ACOGR|nr:hypothetical protein QJS04_geneDACA008378 [Acorus gramineus]